MRRLLASAVAFVSLSGLVAAQSFDTPEALIEAVYVPYTSSEYAEDDSVYRSAALNALFDADAENTPEGEMGALEFNPYVDGQDYELTNLDMGAASIDGDTATVDVTFENFGEPVDLTYFLVDEDGWKIDDLISNNPANPYQLSTIFEEAAGE